LNIKQIKKTGEKPYYRLNLQIYSLSKNLCVELAPLNFGVTAVCPDFVQTPIAETVLATLKIVEINNPIMFIKGGPQSTKRTLLN
jgi:NAD(P)-dependent dehydrogenase (short-subunit alcohol dehydrogenase family)